MPETIIGSGPGLDNLTIGLDTIVLNEHKHWFRQDNGKLYAKVKAVKQDDGSFMLYMIGEPDLSIKKSERRYENV